MATTNPGKTGLRLFVALDPPSAVSEEVAAWARRAAGAESKMRPVPAGNCHVTLAFIGDCRPDEVEAIAEAVGQSAGPAGGLSLGAPVWLPRKKPRALALEIHDSLGELEACHSRLAAALGDAVGWQPQRRFLPHLTAVRLSRGVDPGTRSLPVSPALEFSGEAVTLYRSTLSPEGARYEALSRAAI